MIVMKFGGSSVKNAEMISRVAEIIESKKETKPIVVLSAVKGTTDQLLASICEAKVGIYDEFRKIKKNHFQIIEDLKLNAKIIEEELKELKKTLEVIEKTKEGSKKLTDYISFFGERMCTKIMAAHLKQKGTAAKAIISGDAGMITNSEFGCAEILDESMEKMKNYFSKIKEVAIVTGFGGKDPNGEYTTFARGGSDYVAALIGAAIEAEAIEIWTDVNGIMSTNPNVVQEAKTIPNLTFREAAELAYFGAKVLHPRTILPAINKKIPVKVLNTYEPENQGTTITYQREGERIVKSIAYKKGISIINVRSTRMLNAHGYLAKIFEVFAKNKKPVDMIATSEVSVSMSIDSEENIKTITEELDKISMIKTLKNKSIICVVGQGINDGSGVPGKIFSTLGKEGIKVEMISQCSGNISTGFVIDESQTEKAVQALHKELI